MDPITFKNRQSLGVNRGSELVELSPHQKRRSLPYLGQKASLGMPLSNNASDAQDRVSMTLTEGANSPHDTIDFSNLDSRPTNQLRGNAEERPHNYEPPKKTCYNCRWCLEDGMLFPCCESCCPCLYGDKGFCGYRECCGHKTGNFEPKWVLKIILIITEMIWAVSLQDTKNEFTDLYVRPMAWCAWNAMMLACFIQFCNRMCFGKNGLIDGLSMWIDLVFDDIVQLTALCLYWNYGDGWDVDASEGDHAAAVLSGVLATFFALHNLFALCSLGRKACWGPGFTKDNYDGKAHEDSVWCPYCICPGLAKVGAWFCEICPKDSQKACCHEAFSCCYQPNPDVPNEKECNLFCCEFNFKSGGEDGASVGRICCFLLLNTWIMALWGVHVGMVTVFLIRYSDPDVNPYSDLTIWFAWMACGVGGVCLLTAYVLEFMRAKWIAQHGVRGKLTGKLKAGDFKCLNYVFFTVLVINGLFSVGPWIAVQSMQMSHDGVTTFGCIVSVQTAFFAFMSLWEACKRAVPVFEIYEDDELMDVRARIGLNRTASLMPANFAELLSPTYRSDMPSPMRRSRWQSEFVSARNAITPKMTPKYSRKSAEI